MVAGSKKLLDELAITANGDSLGEAVSLQNGAKNLMILIEVAGLTDGSFVARLQHSPDGFTWFDLDVTAALTANGSQFIAITASSTFHIFRSKITASAVTTGATSVKTFLVHTENRL